MDELDPTNDVVFKLLLLRYPALLRSMVEAILQPVLPIERIDVLNPELPGEVELGSRPRRSIRLDVRVSVQDGAQIDLEMQARKHTALPERLLLYWARLYGSELQAGEDYGTLRPTVAVLWLDDKLYPGPAFHTRLIAYDPALQRRFSDAFSIHILELPKVRAPSSQAGTSPPSEAPSLLHWARFLSAKTKLERQLLAKATPTMEEAKNALEELSLDPAARRMAEARELAEFTYHHTMRAERAEGRREGREEGLRAMLQRLVNKRFGPMPSWAMSRIESAGVSELEGWLDALLDARSLEAVFKGQRV